MEEGRKSPRALVHWRAAIVTETKGRRVTTEAMTNDISLERVSVIGHRHISPNHPVTVYLLIHTGNEDHPELAFEAQGMVMNSIPPGKQGGFRLGIQFTKFVGDSKNIPHKYMPNKPGYGAAYAAPPPAAHQPAAHQPAKTAPAERPAAAENEGPVAEPASSAEPSASAEAAPAVNAPPAADTPPAANAAPVEGTPANSEPPK